MSLSILQHGPSPSEARRTRNLILPPLLQSPGRWLYLRTLLVGFALLLFFPGSPLLGQQFKTRAEEIEQARRDKRARMWRETESPIVQKVNTLVERGLLDGVTSGKGSNGWQVGLGGTRSGQGMSVGLGYRRTDLFGDRLGFRTTFRGTPQLASLVDFELNFPKLETERVFVNFHAKYENSVIMPLTNQILECNVFGIWDGTQQKFGCGFPTSIPSTALLQFLLGLREGTWLP